MKEPSIINIEKHIRIGGSKEFSLINNLTKEETTYPLDIIEKANYYEIDMTNAVILASGKTDIISNSEIFGISRDDKSLIAMIVSFHRGKKMPQDIHML